MTKEETTGLSADALERLAENARRARANTAAIERELARASDTSCIRRLLIRIRRAA